MIDALIDAEPMGLFLLGLQGRAKLLNQHIDMVRLPVDNIAGRVPVIAGAGSNSTRESIDMMLELKKACGELVILCVNQYYNNFEKAC